MMMMMMLMMKMMVMVRDFVDFDFGVAAVEFVVEEGGFVGVDQGDVGEQQEVVVQEY